MTNIASYERFCAGVTHPEEEAYLNAIAGDLRWMTNDSPLATYAGSTYFAGTPECLMRPFLNNLQGRPAGAVLDVAGGKNGRALQDLYARDLTTHALVTNYEDRRGTTTIALDWLDHVEGDLIDAATWRKIEAWKNNHAPQGFSAVMHEPVGALEGLPRSFYLGAIHTLIEWTASEGALLVKIPQSMTADTRAYLDVARRRDVAELRKNFLYALIIKV